MKVLIKTHALGIILALLTGLISVMPNLVFINSDEYKGLPIMATDAESLYLSRINGVYKDCVFICNPYIKEYKDAHPYFNSSLSEVILAAPGIITNTPVLTLKVFYEFFLLSVLSLLTYSLVFRLTKNIWLSIFGASFITLGQNLLNTVSLINFPVILDLLKMKTDYTQFLIFSRPVNPQFSSIYFFIYLHVLLSAVTKKNFKWFFFLALTYGFSFYVYFYVYAFVTVIQGVWLGIFALKKEWRILSFFALVTLVGIVIGFHRFVQVFQLFKHPYYSSIPSESFVRTHIPDLSILGVMLFVSFAALAFLYFKKFKTFSVPAYFIGVLVFACFITRNSHVLSGFILQYFHFDDYMFAPVFVIFICFIIYSFVDQTSLKKYFLVVILASLIPVYNASLIQYKSYQHWIPYTLSAQKYIPVLEWIKNTLPNDSVISAPEIITSLIPVYTKNYVLWAFNAVYWVHLPDREKDYVYSRSSSGALQSIGKKYNIDYYVEENKGDLLKDSNKKKVYEDTNFVVYKD